MSVHPLLIEDIVRRALLEDLGHGRDITSDFVIPEDTRGKAVMRARKNGVLAELETAVTAFRLTDPALIVTTHKKDGEALKAGDAILSVEGAARSILTGERVALNFLSHLSGIATQTAKYVEAVRGTGAKITCTRKTLPNLRALQKYAVKIGGGSNHRFGLDDAILIKDNHIVFAGGIEHAVSRAREQAGHLVKIEIEVDTLAQLETVLNCAVDAVLLDNMDINTLKQAVRMVGGKIPTEASGGVTLDTVQAIAQTGVNYISVGALTHSVTALDIGLDME